MKKTPFVVTDYKCTVCEHKMFIPRKKNNKREKGHIKTMYCPICQKDTDFVQGEER